MRRIIIVLIITFGFAFSGNGSYSGSYLRIGMGPTGQALGNAGVAYLDPVPSSLYYNPALLTLFTSKSIELGYSMMSLDRQFLYISYGMPLQGTAAIGAFYVKSGVGNINGRDNSGEIYGQIENSFHAIQVVFAKDFGPFSMGFGLKLMYELMNYDRYDYVGQGVAIDLGLLYKLRENIWIGLQVKDINGKLESNTSEIFDQGQIMPNRFPTIYKAGFSWRVKPEWGAVYYDFESSSQKEIKHHLGLESSQLMDTFRIRAGLENERFTGGFQVNFKLWDLPSEVNYVYLPSVIDEGDSHSFSWIFSF